MPTDMPAIVTGITTTAGSLLDMLGTFPLNVLVIFMIAGATFGIIRKLKGVAR